jgi:hypothetical protein
LRITVRLGVAARSACHEPAALVFLLLLQALDFTYRCFQPTVSLPFGTSLCRGPPFRALVFFLSLRVQPLHLLARQLQVRREFLFAPETVAPPAFALIFVPSSVTRSSVINPSALIMPYLHE